MKKSLQNVACVLLVIYAALNAIGALGTSMDINYRKREDTACVEKWKYILPAVAFVCYGSEKIGE